MLLIILSYTQIMAGPGRLLEKLNNQNKNIQNQHQLKTARETKLTILKNTQLPLLQQRIAGLLERMPENQKVWDIMTKLKLVGNLDLFQMSESKIMTAEYIVKDSDLLQELLKSIENLNPLISITGISYDLTKARLELISASFPIKTFQPDHNRALPNLSE